MAGLEYRKTTQKLMPLSPSQTAPGQYNPYPVMPFDQGEMRAGFASLAEQVAASKTVILDGFPGILWANMQQELAAALAARDARANWVSVESALLAPDAVDALIAPFLGGDDPLFGTRFSGELRHFFDPQQLAALQPDPSAEVNIIYGTGAALAGWQGNLFYIDVPKNETQFRARSRSIKNIGAKSALDPKPAYKRSYFIDWPAASRHKADLLPMLDWMIDEQRADQPVFITGDALRAALAKQAHAWVRVRPWFEPGPWGGQWIKQHVPQLAQDVPNYAWSFELIAPENGLVFAADGLQMEVSWDMLMFQEYRAVLGECAPNFRHEFPIRYDFLDTFEGGNLSVQCHPRPAYIRSHFGETFTQDECYYILDCAPEAKVYLGFQAGIDPEEFKRDLLHSAQTAAPVEIENYVNALPVKKHDLLLIPNGTIHGAGRGNLVLEISATPYIFTFKMYDWLRLDLDGKPRSLNIERAFENLYFDRQGERIPREFVSHPKVIAQGNVQGADWRIVHCPTHPNHFYDVHRYEFSGSVQVRTGGESGSCHVLSLVEGETVLLETAGSEPVRFNYAETFIVPAAAEKYTLTSESGAPIQVVVTFVKPKAQWAAGVVPEAK